MDTGPSATAPSTEDKAQDAKLGWGSLPALVLETIGSILVKEDGNNGRSDALRARMACKHWHACLTCCISSATLYGSALLVPTATLLPHPPPSPSPSPLPAAAAPVCGCFGPSLTHLTISGPSFHLAWLPLLAAHLPSLTSLSLRAARYHRPWHSPLQRAATTAGPAADAAAAPPAPTDATAGTGAGAAAHAHAGPATSAAAGAAAAVGGQVPTQAAAAAAVASLAGLPVGSLHLAESALNLPSGSLTALVSASLAAAGADEAPLQQQQLQGGGGCWPWASISAAAAAETPHSLQLSSPQLQSRGLRRLEILISDDTPPDILTRVLPLLLPPPPEPVAPPPAPSWSAAALPPLRELILLPAIHATQSVSAAVHQQQHQQRVSYLDLAPLFSDPRLRGVTRLVVPSLQRRAHVAMAAAEQQGGGAGAGAGQQQQLQQQPAGQEEDVVQQLGRLTQLRSLSVLDQVELASFAPACLTHLTGLRQLSLSGGVFVEGVGELRLLTGLKLLRSLELDFRTEWWLDAGDLAVLSGLSALRRLQLSLDYGLDSADSDWDVMYTPPHEVEEDAEEEEEEAKEEVGEEEASEDKDVAIMSDEDLDQWFWSEVREAWRREGALARLRQQRQPRRPLGMRYRMDRILRGPGSSDNWQKALGPLTQLTSLGLRLRHGGGRHLAAALHDAQWLTPRQRKCRRRCRIDEDGEDGSDGDDRDDETDGGNSNGRSDGGSGGDSDGGGVVLELYDAPDIALLDLDFWAKIVSTEQQASTSSSPAAATESAPPPPPLPPLRRQPTCRAPPLVSLTLGGSGHPLLSYGNILCLGLMTDLRSLSLRFETERRMGLQRCSYPRFNPLVALSSLRQLRKLHVLVKHDPQGHGGGGSGCDQAGTAHVAVIDDDVVRVWMYGMPFLQDLSLRGAGRLGERGLSAIGLHGDLRSLRLDLRPLTTMKHASAAAAAAAAALKRQPWDIHEGNASGGGGDAAVADTASRTAVAASMVGTNASDEGTDISSVRIGYGSYYAISAVEVSAPMCPGDDGTSGGAATPTLGVSPPAPWHFTAAVAAAAGAPKWKQSGDDAVGSPAGGSNRGGGGGGKGSNGGAATAVVPVSERAAVRDRRLAEGAMLDSELLAALPYLIRPHHLPPSLAALHLTNAVFSSEWAAFCAAPADLQKTTTKHASAGFPAAATPAHATTPGSAPPGEQLEATLMPPAPSLRRPSARLARLTLRRRPCSSISSLLRTPRIAGRWMGLRSASSGGGGDVSQAAGQPVGDEEIETEGEEGEEVEKEGAAHFDPTRLTDWHLVYFLGCQPCLAHLWLEDPAGRERVTHGSAAPTASGCGSAADDGGGGGGGGGAGVAPKLHHRAIAQLGRLRYLESLTLKVGNRLRWSAQEALFARLPPGLRRLQLHAADLYQEAVRGATRLTGLAELQVIDYTEPSYVPELAEAVRFVQRSLPNCSVVSIFRNLTASGSAEDAAADAERDGYSSDDSDE